VGLVVDKVALGQGFPRLLRFSPVNFIPPVLHYKEHEKKIIFFTGLHNKPSGCGASVAFAAGPFTKKRKLTTYVTSWTHKCVSSYERIKVGFFQESKFCSVYIQVVINTKMCIFSEGIALLLFVHKMYLCF
jgi:hypothetical protein